MRTFFRIGVLLTLLSITGVIWAQQAGGDFCVRAFEDRNANSLRDMGDRHGVAPAARGERRLRDDAAADEGELRTLADNPAQTRGKATRTETQRDRLWWPCSLRKR